MTIATETSQLDRVASYINEKEQFGGMHLGDVVVRLIDEGSEGPAWFDPREAEITVDVGTAGIDISKVKPEHISHAGGRDAICR